MMGNFDGVILKPDLDEIFDDSCFAHYGVKGMHWGVRKAIDSIGGAIQRHKKAKTMRNVGKLMNNERLTSMGRRFAKTYKNRDWNPIFNHPGERSEIKNTLRYALLSPKSLKHKVYDFYHYNPKAINARRKISAIKKIKISSLKSRV